MSTAYLSFKLILSIMSSSIELNGQTFTTSEVIAAIAQSNDPTVDLTTVEAKLGQLNQ